MWQRIWKPIRQLLSLAHPLAIWSVLWSALLAPSALAQPLPAVPSAPASATPAFSPRKPEAEPRWVPVPVVKGRLHAAQLGLVINTADPYSVQVGDYYQQRRGIPPEQVLRLALPLRSTLSEAQFALLQEAIAERFGPAVQALALAWRAPYAVNCQSITGALALGVDAALCQRSCGASRPSPYFNSASLRPWSELSLRPSMLIAAADVEQAKALIDRGVAADGALRLRGRPPVAALFLTSDDRARRVRTALYPPVGLLRASGVDVQVAPASALKDTPRVLLAITGVEHLRLPAPIAWAPGALADHLTSFGGMLEGGHGQSTALDWIASGATASYGTVSEPCNHLQKFPHPQLLLTHYLQGATALEAYWKSVAWPQQGLFIGEPLAAPFSPP